MTRLLEQRGGRGEGDEAPGATGVGEGWGVMSPLEQFRGEGGEERCQVCGMRPLKNAVGGTKIPRRLTVLQCYYLPFGISSTASGEQGRTRRGQGL